MIPIPDNLEEYDPRIADAKRSRRAIEKSDPRLGPHEGRIVELMLAGIKPVCSISRTDESEDIALLFDAVNKGQLIYGGEESRSPVHDWFCQRGQEKNMEKLKSLIRGMNAGTIKADAEYHITLGHLFGYSAEEILFFVAHVAKIKNMKFEVERADLPVFNPAVAAYYMPRHFGQAERRLIGPHEYREVELMLSGQKPVCNIVVSRDTPYIQDVSLLFDAAARGELVYGGRVYWQNAHTYYFCQKGQEKNMALLTSARKKSVCTDEDHIMNGVIFGYTDEEIRAYFDNRRKRENDAKALQP